MPPRPPISMSRGLPTPSDHGYKSSRVPLTDQEHVNKHYYDHHHHQYHNHKAHNNHQHHSHPENYSHSRARPPPPQIPSIEIEPPQNPSINIEPPQPSSIQVRSPEIPVIEVQSPELPVIEVQSPELPVLEVHSPELPVIEVQAPSIQAPSIQDKSQELPVFKIEPPQAPPRQKQPSPQAHHSRRSHHNTQHAHNSHNSSHSHQHSREHNHHSHDSHTVPPRRNLPRPKQMLNSHEMRADQTPVHTCAVCRKFIDNDERVVQTNGVHLHVSCFRCWHCRMQLELSQFYFVAETQRLYCHLDYHELFSQRCAYCETPIEGNAIYALDKHWHAGHFFCAQCNKPFKEDEDYCILGKTAWCEPCYSNKTALSCWKCLRKLLNGEACIEALGRNWCNTCFCCEECLVPFQSNEFILREDGTLVCLPCEAKRIRDDVWKSH